MKKTVVIILSIFVVLFAFAACSNPAYPGGFPGVLPPSQKPDGTPVSDTGSLESALSSGEDVYLSGSFTLEKPLVIPEGATIDGNKNSITLEASSASSNEGILTIDKGSVTIKNLTIIVPENPNMRSGSAEEPSFALLIGSGDGNLASAPSGIVLENVTIKTGNKTAGLNIHTAKNVTISNFTIDECLKAPISISSSENVKITGKIDAAGSSWYQDADVIQINGLDGGPNHEASSVDLSSASGFDYVWQEAVAEDYGSSSATSSDYAAADQSRITMPAGYKPVFIDNASGKVKGWAWMPVNEVVDKSSFDNADDYKIFTDSYYNRTGSDVRTVTDDHKLDLSSGGIGFYFGTQSSITFGSTTQCFDNTVKAGDVYLMTLKYSDLTGNLSIGGNLFGQNNNPTPSGEGIKEISGSKEGIASVVMAVTENQIVVMINGNVAGIKSIGIVDPIYRCGFTAWGNCKVESISIDKIDLDLSTLINAMN